MSIGTPTKQASSPSAVVWAGSRIMVAGPANRGISLPPSGWLNSVMVFSCQAGGKRRLRSAICSGDR